jgi:protein-S-isoprenylcysteine O-methyltransferase Ste14
MKLNHISLAVALGVVLGAAIHVAQPPWTAWRLLGLAIGIPSFALLAIARWQLGMAFTVRAKANGLVTTGLYRRLRNPIYLFGGLLILGCILYFQQFWFLLLLPVVVPMQIIRARHEAEVLEAEYGEEYRRYRAQTWF